MKIGGSIDNDNFLMTFMSMELLDEYKYKTSEPSSTSLYVEDGTYELKPANTSSVYTSYKAESDKVTSMWTAPTASSSYVVCTPPVTDRSAASFRS